MTRKRPSISIIFLVAMLVVAILSIGIIGYFLISQAYDAFSRESQQLRVQFLEEQQVIIRNEVEKVIDYIEYRRSTTEERLRNALRERVHEAHSIAGQLYDTYNSALPRSAVAELIKEALRPIRFNNGRGYYFGVTMEGVEILYPVAPQFENQNLIDLQDATGQYVIRDEIKVVSENGQGFVIDHWRKPNAEDKMIYPKITFVKRFSPLNWYLGTGEYLDDFEQDLKNELIERIAEIRFGTEGYIFINTYDGDAILKDGKQVAQKLNLWDLTDPNGVKVIQKEREAARNPQGDYIYYTWNKLTRNEPAPKVSFIKGIADWQWMVGAGVYLDEVERLIAEKKKDLETNVRSEVTRTAVVLLLFGLFIIFLMQFFTQKMKRGLKAFTDFFQRAATGSITINEAKLPFSELVELAHAANSMIEDRNKAENEKMVLQERLARSKKMEALGLLTGGVAHDLNNILSGFVSYPELLLMDIEADSKLRKPLETIHECGLRAAAIVNDLLDSSRGSKGMSEVLNINTAVEKFIASPEHAALAKRHAGSEISCRLAHDLLNVRCSSAHLAKTLMNLVANAMEATGGAGHIVITTENRYAEDLIPAYEEIPPDEYAVLRVADDGPGILEDDLSRIFEPFFTKKILGRSGMGLGLAVVWHTVHDHNGFIDVTSSMKGTTFELYFPVSRDEPQATPLPLAFEELKGLGQRILVVDDEANQREIACALLESLGYKTVAVADGEKAIEWLNQNQADLLILDMILGRGLNGRQTYEQVLKIHPRQKAIIVSGYAKTEDVRITLDLGAGAMIAKPYTLQALALAVRTELGRKPDTP